MIVVIGILATLVIVTFAGIQKKARDSQRQTDVQAVNAQIEAFYTQYGYNVTGSVAGTCPASGAGASDPTGVVTTNNGCDTYTLKATLEGGGPYTKSSN